MTFLVSDSNIVHDDFLEYINMMLATGKLQRHNLLVRGCDITPLCVVLSSDGDKAAEAAVQMCLEGDEHNLSRKGHEDLRLDQYVLLCLLLANKVRETGKGLYERVMQRLLLFNMMLRLTK